MRNTIEGFLKETEDLSDDTVLGASIGTDFYWNMVEPPSVFGVGILMMIA